MKMSSRGTQRRSAFRYTNGSCPERAPRARLEPVDLHVVRSGHQGHRVTLRRLPGDRRDVHEEALALALQSVAPPIAQLHAVEGAKHALWRGDLRHGAVIRARPARVLRRVTAPALLRGHVTLVENLYRPVKGRGVARLASARRLDGERRGRAARQDETCSDAQDALTSGDTAGGRPPALQLPAHSNAIVLHRSARAGRAAGAEICNPATPPTSAFRFYSGGLGALAGDHLKSAATGIHRQRWDSVSGPATQLYVERDGGKSRSVNMGVPWGVAIIPRCLPRRARPRDERGWRRGCSSPIPALARPEARGARRRRTDRIVSDRS